MSSRKLSVHQPLNFAWVIIQILSQLSTTYGTLQEMPLFTPDLRSAFHGFWLEVR